MSVRVSPLLILTLSLATAPALAAPRYHLEQISAPASAHGFRPVGLWDNGQVVAEAYFNGAPLQVVVWSNGIASQPVPVIAMPFGGFTYTVGRSGHIAGSIWPDEFDYLPFVWFDGQLTIIPPGPKQQRPWGRLEGGVLGVNRSGVAAGVVHVAGSPRAYLWKDGSALDLGASLDEPSSAVSIDDRGVVLIHTPTKSYLWERGSFTQLPTLGGASSTAYAMNNLGQVIGRSDTPAVEGQGALWPNGAISELPPLPGDTIASPTSINDLGLIVGRSFVRDEQSRPVLWENGQVFDLHELVDAPPGLMLGEPVAINNRGQILITAWGGHDYVPVLLTPIPEPAAMGSLAMVPLLLRRRR